jgi:hypothetical protein
VAGNVLQINAQGDRIGTTRFHGDAVGNVDAVPAGEPYLMHPFLMVRLSAINAVGGYRHTAHCEDTDLYFRLEPLGRLHVLDDILGSYRIHAGGVTSRSVQNVRVSAVYSQLAALSAKRRAGGRRDFSFPALLVQQVQAAPSLAAMIALVSADLDEDEKSYLEVRVAAKMIQLRVYRAFRFGSEDVHTIIQLIGRHWNAISHQDKITLFKTPFYYYYKPRAYLSALKATFRKMTGRSNS